MITQRLGDTDLFLPTLGIGTWAFGGLAYGAMDDREALHVIQIALDAGANFLDTSSNYGRGRSEELIGQAVSDRRYKAMLCTKGGTTLQGGKAQKCFTPQFLEKSLDESLKRLRTDFIDLYLLHNPPPEAIVQESVCEWLSREKNRGRIRHWGLSAYDRHEDARLAIEAGAKAIEGRYSLLRTDILSLVGNELKQSGCGFIARSPLDGGLLSGKYDSRSWFDPATDQRSRLPKDYFEAITEALGNLAWLVSEGHAGSLQEAAIRFSAFGQGVTCCIAGAKSVSQLTANLAAIEKGPLSESALSRIVRVRESFGQQTSSL